MHPDACAALVLAAPQEEEALTLNQVAALARMRMAAARREIEEAELLEKAEALKAEAARKALVGAASALDSAAPAQPTQVRPCACAAADARDLTRVQAQATLPVDPPKKRGVRGARKHLLPASGYHGVIKKSPMCFQAKTSFQSQLVFIGSFSSAEAAARAYDTCMRGLEASRSLAMPATQYNFPSDDVAGHAVAEAEKLMKQQLASMRARFEQGTQGDGGDEDGDGEGGMAKQRRMSAPSTKACTTCGAEMLRRMRVCRACREVAATACAMRGVRTKLKPDGETRYQAFFWHEGENKYLGSFHTEVEAAQCYDERVRAILGNALGDVRLNFASPQEAQAAVDKALEVRLRSSVRVHVHESLQPVINPPVNPWTLRAWM